MCPPTYSRKKRGLERIYNWHSYFLSSGLDETSVIIFERSYNEHYIKAVELVSSINTSRLVEMLKIEKSQPWTNPISSKSDTKSQFPLSATSSPDRQSTTSSIFSTSSPDRISAKSTFSSASSSDRSSQSSFYGVSSPERSPVASLQGKSSLVPFYGTSSPDKRSAFRAVHVNHDRYVAEEETVKFSRFKSIKNRKLKCTETFQTPRFTFCILLKLFFNGLKNSRLHDSFEK